MPEDASSPPAAAKRVRTGCLTCRRRRRKCDERKPTCLKCEEKSLACHYGVNLSFRGANAKTVGPEHARQSPRYSRIKFVAAKRGQEKEVASIGDHEQYSTEIHQPIPCGSPPSSNESGPLGLHASSKSPVFRNTTECTLDEDAGADVEEGSREQSMWQSSSQSDRLINKHLVYYRYSLAPMVGSELLPISDTESDRWTSGTGVYHSD